MAAIFRSGTAEGPWIKIGTGTSPLELAEQPAGNWWYTVQNPGDGSDIQPSDYGTPVNIRVFASPIAPSVEKRALDILVTLPALIEGTSTRLQASPDKATWTTINDNAPQTLTLAPDVGTWYYRVQVYDDKSVSAFGAASAAVVIAAPQAPVLSLNLQSRTLNWTNPGASSLTFDVYKNNVVVASNITAQSYTDRDMVSKNWYKVIGFATGQSTASNEVVAQLLFMYEVLLLPEGTYLQDPTYYREPLTHVVPAGTEIDVTVDGFYVAGTLEASTTAKLIVSLQSKDFQQQAVVYLFEAKNLSNPFTVFAKGATKTIIVLFDCYYVNVYTEATYPGNWSNTALQLPITIEVA